MENRFHPIWLQCFGTKGWVPSISGLNSEIIQVCCFMVTHSESKDFTSGRINCETPTFCQESVCDFGIGGAVSI